MNYEIKKNNRLSKKGIDEFWKKESQANLTRKADISNLDYIFIPFDRLPTEDNPDQTINSYRDTILSHLDKKILNLNGISNTELKMKYGASNIHLLSEYDNNYTVLVAILQKWGERLYKQGFHKEALAVLESALDCRTDVHKTFELLAKIYIEQGSHDKINLLMDGIPSAHIRNKDKLLLKLQELIKS
jgi:tetratricopeptide (TPR) repeat protein